MTSAPTTFISRQRILLGLAIMTAASLFFLTPAAAKIQDGAASWNPVASERLTKLPGNYLKRAIDHDFAKSGLAGALQDTEGLIRLKKQTLNDLQGAMEQADGDLRTELQHQFLAEKRQYLRLVGKQQDLRRRQSTTKIKVFERLLRKLGGKRAAITPRSMELAKMQEDAQRRFKASINQVDMKLFRNAAITESRYAREYAKNLAAIETLVAAVNAHPMNSQSEIGGRPVTKEDYLRQLITESEAELATLDQEGTVLAYMAKLISLDALALSEDVAGDDPDVEDGEDPISLTSSVDFFITR